MAGTPSPKTVFSFIGQPFSFYLGVTAITSILFLDNYLLLQDSSIGMLDKTNYTDLEQILTFLVCYFLCLHISAFPLRMLTYLMVLAWLELLEKMVNKDFSSIIYKTYSMQDYRDFTNSGYKRPSQLLQEAIEEKNSIKYSLYSNSIEKEKADTSLKNILFALSILIPINFYFPDSITRIFGYDMEAWMLVGMVSIAIFWYSLYQKDYKVYVPKPYKSSGPLTVEERSTGT